MAYGQTQSWDSLVDRFFDQANFHFHPSAETSAGFHRYDAMLEDFSLNSIRREALALQRFEREYVTFRHRS